MTKIRNLVNTYQALRTLKVNKDSSFEEIKIAYRKLALEFHPDRNTTEQEGIQFKKINEAYKTIKEYYKDGAKPSFSQFSHTTERVKKQPKWGTPPGQEPSDIPEQDWSKFTKEFESENPDFWKEYEKKFWEEYNARVSADGKNGEFEKAKEPREQPNLFVDVDESLCIGCCSCETIAPDVFAINKNSKMNPKSSVINQKGAGVNKIMNAAETCPTKAIIVENKDTDKRLYPR